MNWKTNTKMDITTIHNYREEDVTNLITDTDGPWLYIMPGDTAGDLHDLIQRTLPKRRAEKVALVNYREPLADTSADDYEEEQEIMAEGLDEYMSTGRTVVAGLMALRFTDVGSLAREWGYKLAIFNIDNFIFALEHDHTFVKSMFKHDILQWASKGTDFVGSSLYDSQAVASNVPDYYEEYCSMFLKEDREIAAASDCIEWAHGGRLSCLEDTLYLRLLSISALSSFKKVYHLTK
jgi:hypothetical protein